MEERTEWRGHNESQIGGEEMRSGRLIGAAKTSKERAEWSRLQQRNLTHWSAEKERVASVPPREQLASTPEPKGEQTEPSVQSTRS